MKYNELIGNEHYITGSSLVGIFNTLILILRRLLKPLILHREEKRGRKKLDGHFVLFVVYVLSWWGKTVRLGLEGSHRQMCKHNILWVCGEMFHCKGSWLVKKAKQWELPQSLLGLGQDLSKVHWKEGIWKGRYKLAECSVKLQPPVVAQRCKGEGLSIKTTCSAGLLQTRLL